MLSKTDLKSGFNATVIFYILLMCCAEDVLSSEKNDAIDKPQLSDFTLNDSGASTHQTLNNSSSNIQENATSKSDLAANTQNKNRFRAGLEISLFIGTGIIGYNYWQEKMKDDWEFEYKNLDDYLERFFTTDQIKFDDNDILYNWGHVYAGAFYHQVGRVNGYSNYESLLISMAGSSVWEYVIEFREAISINDQVMTGIGGAILGETFYQMASLLKKRSKTPLAKLIANYLQPIDIAETLFDRNNIALNTIERQPLGFSKGNLEKFTIFTGSKHVLQSSSHYSVFELGLAGEMIKLPIASPGSSNRITTDTVAVEITQTVGLNQNGIRDYYSYTKVVPSAFFSKRISSNQNGYSLVVGPAAGTEYNSRGFGHKQDFYAMVNLLGGTFDLIFFRNQKSLRMALDIYGDVAFVRPFVTNPYFATGNTYVDAKTILRKKTYYYAIGTSMRSRVEAQVTKKLALGFTGVYHKLRSFDEGNKDRRVEGVKRKLALMDGIGRFKTWISYDLKHRWSVTGILEKSFRSGTIDESSSQEKTTFNITGTETVFKLELNYDIL